LRVLPNKFPVIVRTQSTVLGYDRRDAIPALQVNLNLVEWLAGTSIKGVELTLWGYKRIGIAPLRSYPENS